MSFLLVLALGLSGFSSTVGGDVLFQLGRPAGDAALLGVDLAFPHSFGNPAALGFRQGWELSSSYCSPFGAGHFGSIALVGPSVGAEVFLFYAGEIVPGLVYRAEGGAFSLGVALGALGLGARARVLHFAQPKEGLGGSLDLGFLWQGSLWLGGLVENAWALPPVAQEAWPLDLSWALVLPLRMFGFPVYLGLAAQDLFSLPIYSGTFALELGGFSLAAGLGTPGLSLGGRLSWSFFRLEWAFLGHAHLPWSFRVSFALQWF